MTYFILSELTDMIIGYRVPVDGCQVCGEGLSRLAAVVAVPPGAPGVICTISHPAH